LTQGPDGAPAGLVHGGRLCHIGRHETRRRSGAHRDPPAAIAAAGEAIVEALAELKGLSRETLRRQRRDKFLAIGRDLD
jgi:acetyl-CoA carboxylase carboxyl transferase subunit alpha